MLTTEERKKKRDEIVFAKLAEADKEPKSKRKHGVCPPNAKRLPTPIEE